MERFSEMHVAAATLTRKNRWSILEQIGALENALCRHVHPKPPMQSNASACKVFVLHGVPSRRKARQCWSLHRIDADPTLHRLHRPTRPPRVTARVTGLAHATIWHDARQLVDEQTGRHARFCYLGAPQRGCLRTCGHGLGLLVPSNRMEFTSLRQAGHAFCTTSPVIRNMFHSSPSSDRRYTMGLFTSKEFNSLDELLVDQLQDLYDAEYRITSALPKMAEAADNPQLRSAFERHLTETKGHINRLERVFKQLGREPQRESCAAMKGIVSEGEEMVDAKGDAAVKDAALIAAAQRVEHYEIAGYGTARTLAQQIGRSDVANLLQETLDEEGAADKKLTQIAESSVNRQAAMA
jgi:ferritin-like metal-binding protein YciE